MNIPLCRGHPKKPSWPRDARCLVGDNGVDPVLGPPWPPTNYQLFIDPTNQPRLTWTVPDLIINLEATLHTIIVTQFTATILNYAWPTFDPGAIYITNQRVTSSGVRYYSLQDNNSGKTPNLFTDFWAPDPTEFSLWQFNPQSGIFDKVGDSAGGFDSTWSWASLTFSLTTGTLADESNHTFYVASRAFGQTAFSQNFQVTLPITTSAPGAGDWSVSTSATIPEGVDFSRLAAFPSNVDGLLFQFRVNGSGDPFVWDGNIWNETDWSVSMPLGSTLYDFEIAWTNGPTRVSEYSAVKTATSWDP